MGSSQRLISRTALRAFDEARRGGWPTGWLVTISAPIQTAASCGQRRLARDNAAGSGAGCCCCFCCCGARRRWTFRRIPELGSETKLGLVEPLGSPVVVALRQTTLRAPAPATGGRMQIRRACAASGCLSNKQPAGNLLRVCESGRPSSHPPVGALSAARVSV